MRRKTEIYPLLSVPLSYLIKILADGVKLTMILRIGMGCIRVGLCFGAEGIYRHVALQDRSMMAQDTIPARFIVPASIFEARLRSQRHFYFSLLETGRTANRLGSGAVPPVNLSQIVKRNSLG